jgi:hypothetical protein
MSQSKWLVSAVVPGLNDSPLRSLTPTKRRRERGNLVTDQARHARGAAPPFGGYASCASRSARSSTNACTSSRRPVLEREARTRWFASLRESSALASRGRHAGQRAPLAPPLDRCHVLSNRPRTF